MPSFERASACPNPDVISGASISCERSKCPLLALYTTTLFVLSLYIALVIKTSPEFATSNSLPNSTKPSWSNTVSPTELSFTTLSPVLFGMNPT